MLKKLKSTIVLCVASVAVFAQTGALKVIVKDKETGETIPGAIVTTEVNGVPAGKPAVTDIDGEVIIKPLNPGTYTVKAQYTGKQDKVINGVVVGVEKTAYITIDLAVKTELLKEVEIVQYIKPLIEPGTTSGGTVTRQEYQNMATKNISSVAATTAGVYQADEGGALSLRGSRSSTTSYFVDGMKVIGSTGLPQSSVEQITVITGGVPASYGDVTGGVISVTTRGPQSRFAGGVEVVSSQITDPYGYNLLGWSVGGPIISKKDSALNMKKPVLGFFFSGEVVSDKDSDPSAVGTWRVKDDVRTELEKDPLRPSESGSGMRRNAEYLTSDDLEQIKYKENAASRQLRLQGKLQYKIGNNTNLILGGSIDRGNRHQWVREYSLVNAVNNPVFKSNTWRVFGTITQRFGSQDQSTDEKSSSNIKNAFYTLQASYEKSSTVQEDDTHKDNLFNYGYVGKFVHHKTPFYFLLDGRPQGTAYYQVANVDTMLTFEPSSLNPLGANWTTAVYNYIGEENIDRTSDIQFNLGLANGDRPSDIYGLWFSTGRQYGGRALSEFSQFRVFTNFSGDIKNHQIKVGLEYEQRDLRAYSVAPIALWQYMRQFANAHITELDTANPYLVSELSGNGYNYYRYDRRYDGDKQYYFDKSVRKKLGLAENNVDWIDIDALDPSDFSLDMFSPDELQQNGLASYYGYDHTGKKIKSNSTIEDFFSKKDENGNFARSVPSYRPIYMAGYIEDNFDFKDLKFRVGLRVDRFDANQKVLKDPFVLDEVKTAGEVNYSVFNTTRPGNIGDDYVVYVNDPKAPTSIKAYRDGSNWYSVTGAQMSGPASLTDAGYAPYVLNPNEAQKISSKAFKDYEPQVNLMPRIAFSFPISDVANFFAHYDILTQRPDEGYNRLDVVNYYYLATRGSGFITNPALKPQRTTDYELGFAQILNEKKNSALHLSAFYRELRDMVQVVAINGAYPANYTTMGNIDFGTVKGFVFTYDLRRTAGVQLNASYTLQFADGTGSSAADGINLVNTGTPNLRTTVPLDYDQRHRLVTTFDYRFGSGSDYHGPTYTSKKGDSEKTKQILANVGANLVLNVGSGVPYTKSSNAVSIVSGSTDRSTILGSIKGSNLPWTFRADVRVDKGFKVTWGGKDKEESQKKVSMVNVYIQLLNALNRRNVQAVYKYTGNASDDGFLSSPEYQGRIAEQTNPESFKEFYAIKMVNPDYYSIPRKIRIGLTMDF